MFNDIVIRAEDDYKSVGGDFDLAIAEAGYVAEVGDYGIAVCGPGGVAKAGEGGILIFLDDSTGSRVVATFYVGENDIAPNEFYEFDGNELFPSSISF